MSGIKLNQVVTIYIKTNTHDRIQCKRIIQGILRAIDRFAGESRSQNTTNSVLQLLVSNNMSFTITL